MAVTISLNDVMLC